jgi:hypothetical protein
MKLHLLRMVVPTVLLLFCAPRVAHADEVGFWRWLDRLSGPGPCNGVILDQRLFSTGFRSGDHTQTTASTFFDPGGVALDETRSRRPIMYGVQWGGLRCDNELPYEGRSAPTVWAFPLAATADVRVHRGIDVGVTVGATGFVGDQFSTWRFTVGPRVSVSPALFVREPTRRHRALKLTITASSILGDLDASDFGASGDFKGGNEVLWGASLSLNLLSLRK